MNLRQHIRESDCGGLRGSDVDGIDMERHAQASSNSDCHESSSGMWACAQRSRMKFSRTSTSMCVRWKHRAASSGVHTMGWPRTLNEVFTINAR